MRPLAWFQTQCKHNAGPVKNDHWNDKGKNARPVHCVGYMGLAKLPQKYKVLSVKERGSGKVSGTQGLGGSRGMARPQDFQGLKHIRLKGTGYEKRRGKQCAEGMRSAASYESDRL